MSDGLLLTAPKVTKVVISIDKNPLSLQKRNLLSILNKIPDKLSDKGKDKLLLRLSEQKQQSSGHFARTVDISNIKSALEGFSFNETILPEVSSSEKVTLRGRDMQLHFALRDRHGVEKGQNRVQQKVARALLNSREQQAVRLARIQKYNRWTQRLTEKNQNRIWGGSLVEQSLVQKEEALQWLQDPTLDGSRSKSRDSVGFGRSRSVFGTESRRIEETADAKGGPVASGRSESGNRGGRVSAGRRPRVHRLGADVPAVLITESDQVEKYERRVSQSNEQDYQLRLTRFIKKVDLAKQKASRAIDTALENLGSEPEWLEQANNE